MCPETETASRVRVRGAASTPAGKATPILKRSHPLDSSGQTAKKRNPFRRAAKSPALVAPIRSLTPAQHDRLRHVLGLMSTAGLVDLTMIDVGTVAQAATDDLGDGPLGFDEALGSLDPTAGSLRIGLDPPAKMRVTIPAKGVPDGVAEGLAPLLADTIAPAQLMGHVGGLLVHSVLTPEQASLVNQECGATFVPVFGSRQPITVR